MSRWGIYRANRAGKQAEAEQRHAINEIKRARRANQARPPEIHPSHYRAWTNTVVPYDHAQRILLRMHSPSHPIPDAALMIEMHRRIRTSNADAADRARARARQRVTYAETREVAG